MRGKKSGLRVDFIVVLQLLLCIGVFFCISHCRVLYSTVMGVELTSDFFRLFRWRWTAASLHFPNQLLCSLILPTACTCALPSNILRSDFCFTDSQHFPVQTYFQTGCLPCWLAKRIWTCESLVYRIAPPLKLLEVKNIRRCAADCTASNVVGAD